MISSSGTWIYRSVIYVYRKSSKVQKRECLHDIRAITARGSSRQISHLSDVSDDRGGGSRGVPDVSVGSVVSGVQAVAALHTCIACMMTWLITHRNCIFSKHFSRRVSLLKLNLSSSTARFLSPACHSRRPVVWCRSTAEPRITNRPGYETAECPRNITGS